MEYKSFLQSKTLYSLLVVIITWALQHFAATKTLDPSGWLDVVLAILQGAGMGGAVAGRWVANKPLSLTGPPRDPPAMVMAGKSMLVLIMAGIMLGLGGCADTQTPIVREGIYQGYAPIISEYKTWMAQKQAAGTLSADDVRIRTNTLNSVDALVTTSRANDGKTFLSGQ